jgi:hypothetical protein
VVAACCRTPTPAQGDDHPARPRHGRDDAAAGSGPAYIYEGLPRDAGGRADGRSRGRGAVHEPHDERRVERHRARDGHRAAHGVRVRHPRSGPVAFRKPGNAFDQGSRARRERSDRAARRREIRKVVIAPTTTRAGSSSATRKRCAYWPRPSSSRNRSKRTRSESCWR